MASQGTGRQGGDRGRDEKRPKPTRNESRMSSNSRSPKRQQMAQGSRSNAQSSQPEQDMGGTNEGLTRVPRRSESPTSRVLGLPQPATTRSSPETYQSSNQPGDNVGRVLLQPYPEHLFITPELPVNPWPSKKTGEFGILDSVSLPPSGSQFAGGSSPAGLAPRPSAPRPSAPSPLPSSANAPAMLTMTQPRPGIDAMYLPPPRSEPMPFLEIDPSLRESLQDEHIVPLRHPLDSELARLGWIEFDIWRYCRRIPRSWGTSCLGTLEQRAGQQERCALQTSWFGPMPYENWKDYKDRAGGLGIDNTPDKFFLRHWFDWRQKNEPILASTSRPGAVETRRWEIRREIREKQKEVTPGGILGANFRGEYDRREDDDPGSRGGGGSGGWRGYGGGDPTPAGGSASTAA